MSDGIPTLQHYRVYGHCLASTVVFPELRAVDPAEVGGVRWRFATAPALPPMVDATPLGAEQLYEGVAARLLAHRDGHRIEVDDTGSFDLATDRRTITLQPRPGAWPDFVRAHLVGRVLGTALYLDGLLPLHGSAVETRAGVIGFLAPKGFGKSSLALALTQAGARLVTDDALPVALGARADGASADGAPADGGAAAAQAWPGVSSLRVHDDAVAAVGAVGAADSALRSREGKQIVAPAEVVSRPLPLAALYLLAPTSGGDATTLRATALPPTLAAISVLSHVKIGAMLGPGAAAPMLARAAALARAVPVHRLQLPRALPTLVEVARTLLQWHGGAPA